MQVFTLIYVSILFEWVLPKINAKYTADYYDIIMYIVGLLVFYFIQNILKKDELLCVK